MYHYKIKLECPTNYNLYMTCHAHGWKNLSPFFWDETNSELLFSINIDKISIDISVKQISSKIVAVVKTFNPVFKDKRKKIKKIIQRCVSLNCDTAELLCVANNIGHEYPKLIRKGAGRLLRSPTLWEDAAKTLFTTNCSWALTKKMCEAACSGKFVSATPDGNFPFPPPEMFEKFTESEIRALIPLGYRAKYFLSLASAFSKDSSLDVIENKVLCSAEAFKVFNKLIGFGSYASAHLLIMAGYYDMVPIDSVVISYLKKAHNANDPKSFIDRQYGKWGKYKWWGLKLEKMVNLQNWLGN